MPFHTNRGHVPLRTSTAGITTRAVEGQIIETICHKCREFTSQVFAKQRSRKFMVEGVPWDSPNTGRGLETGIVRVAEIEINLEGARQRTGHTEPDRLCVSARKEARSGGREFFVTSGYRRSWKPVAQNSSSVRRPSDSPENSRSGAHSGRLHPGENEIARSHIPPQSDLCGPACSYIRLPPT